MEAIDPKHPSYFCVVTIAEMKGARLRLHFDVWSESYDFWANADSEYIFPVNWCSKHGQSLHPPRSKLQLQFYIKLFEPTVGVPNFMFAKCDCLHVHVG